MSESGTGPELGALDGQVVDDDDGDRCVWCERISGLILIGGAVAMLYIGFDMITGGWLSRQTVGVAQRAADAIDTGPAAEGTGSGEPAAST